jgi:phage terminase large subunit-like protein
MARDPALERLALLPKAKRLGVLRKLGAAEYNELQARWEAYAFDGQAEPSGPWRVWMVRGGRGFGKTRAGAEWISARARENPSARIALVGATLAEARRVMVDGESGLLAVARPGEEPVWYPSRGLLVFPSGAEAQIFSAAAPESLRGPGHDFAWCDELGKWKGDAGIEAWNNLMLTMRRGTHPRTMVTTTPRTTALMRRVRAADGFVETLGRTADNPWLAESFVEAMMADFGGTRLERQELDGELIDEVEGALWPPGLIEARRVAEPPELVRVVVGVDPPASAGGDACGIVAVGLGRDGCAYVIEDASVSGATPDGWARAVAACAARHNADRAVAEKNQGGDMVATTLRAADAGLPLQLVHASRGKAARAEPVSLLYEAGKAFHAGVFPALEAELGGLQMGGGYEGPGRSPDRADACVWAMTAVMLGKVRVARVRGF